MSKTTFSIRDLASEFDVTTRSIRFYEDQGLLFPTRKGQTRIYSSQDRVRLKLILRGKRLGFSLAESKELFELWDQTPGGSMKQLERLQAKITEKKQALEQQLNDIAMLQIELDSAEARCQSAMQELLLQEQKALQEQNAK
ncbi:MerR family transcriptional regulator [Aliamphritea spongicola]|uniref:MerR family transcriptional regulator n=1 Tax=Aliamphritea spongicola TaxID=707589 RepID=UPI00196AB705|nr:MerR family DNA-binding transcriptional regulator [Aliamphritea spongicola]MBN3561762.1 MerR family DNA-binding transcriptional regulator [Aliamphritea spongicola]